jgi:hypothetical protein
MITDIEHGRGDIEEAIKIITDATHSPVSLSLDLETASALVGALVDISASLLNELVDLTNQVAFGDTQPPDPEGERDRCRALFLDDLRNLIPPVRFTVIQNA